MRHFIFLLFVLCAAVGLTAQIGELTYGGPAGEFSRDLVELDNGDLLMAGASNSYSQNGSSRAFLIKTDSQGAEIWRRAYSDYTTFVKIFEDEGGTLTAFISRTANGSGFQDDDLYLVSLAENGDINSEVLIGDLGSYNVMKTSDNHFLILGNGAFGIGSCAAATKVSSTGQVVWTDCIGRDQNDVFFEAIEDSDGNYLVGGISYVSGGFDAYIVKYTPNGVLIWERFNTITPGHNYYVGGMQQMTNGNYLIMQTDRVIIEPNVLTPRDIAFQEISRQTGNAINSNSIIQVGDELPVGLYEKTAGEYYVLSARKRGELEAFDIELRRIDENLQVDSVASYGGLLREYPVDLIVKPNDSLILLGQTNSFGQGENDFYLLLADENGQIETNRLEGRTVFDTLQNCLAEAEEQGLDRWVVTAENGVDTTYSLTFANGHYSLPLEEGDYQVSVQSPSDYWLLCFDTLPVLIDGTNPTIADFPAQAEVLCPDLASNITTYYLDPCSSGLVDVHYTNWGTAPADSAWVDVIFDTALTLLDSSDIPGVPLGNNTYRFLLGELDINANGFFRVPVSVSCDLEPDQAILLESQIFPDTICGPEGNFSGAVLELGARCTGDEVELTITNVGEEIMMNPQNYIVIEDAVLRETAPVTLEADQALTLTYDATGTTFTLSIPQEPGAPGTTLLYTAVEGCNSLQGGGMASRGLTNQFPLENDGSQSTAQFYFPSATPLDFSNGIAFPQGFGPNNVVMPNSRITYSLPFDFRLPDSLRALSLLVEPSPHLDLSSLRLEESSHPFQASIRDGNTLAFYFDGLPGRDVNEPGTGYINFSMRLQPDLSSGTQIVNQYSIQTDFDEKFILGQSFHTVGYADLTVIVSDDLPIGKEEVLIQAFPNPFVDRVQFQWTSLPGAERVNIEIYDTSGRLIDHRSTDYIAGGNLSWERGYLPAGVYQFVLTQGNEVLQSGRLLAH